MDVFGSWRMSKPELGNVLKNTAKEVADTLLPGTR
jgi:hypothetical protein